MLFWACLGGSGGFLGGRILPAVRFGCLGFGFTEIFFFTHSFVPTLNLEGEVSFLIFSSKLLNRLALLNKNPSLEIAHILG